MGRRRRRSLLNKRSQVTGSLPTPTPVDGEKEATETPADAAPPADGPAVDAAPAEEPASEEPASEEPAAEEAAPEEPASEEPASEEAAPEESASEEPAPDESAPDESAPADEEPASEEASENEPGSDEDAPVRFVAYREMLLGWRPKPKAQRPRTYVTFAELQLAASIAALAVVMLVVGTVGLAVVAWAFANG